MEKKIDKLSELMKGNDWKKAITLAAKFPRLGEHKQEITRAASVLLSPGMYISMGKNPEDLLNAGVIALQKRYPNHV